jgi:hypothetical protein
VKPKCYEFVGGDTFEHTACAGSGMAPICETLLGMVDAASDAKQQG